MQDLLPHLKKQLNQFIQGYSHSFSEELIGITMVGSHAEGNKATEALNDLDIVIVVKKLNKELYEKLIEDFKKFADSNSSDEWGLVVEVRFGPFKTASDKQYTLQLHLLIFDTESFKDYSLKSPLVAFDWLRFKPQFGAELRVLTDLEKLTTEDIIKARGGIDYSLEQIKEGTNIMARQHFNENGVLERVIEKEAQNFEQKAETCYKSIKNTLLNIYKFKNKQNIKPTDEQINSLITEILNAEDSHDIVALEKVYTDARNGFEIPSEKLVESQDKAIRILENLKKFLEKA